MCVYKINHSEASQSAVAHWFINSHLLFHNDSRVTQLWLFSQFKLSRNGTVSPIFELQLLDEGQTEKDGPSSRIITT